MATQSRIQNAIDTDLSHKTALAAPRPKRQYSPGSLWCALARVFFLPNPLDVVHESAATTRPVHGRSLVASIASNAGELRYRARKRILDLLRQHRFRHG